MIKLKDLLSEDLESDTRMGVAELERLQTLLKNYFDISKRDFMKLVRNKRDLNYFVNHFKDIPSSKKGPTSDGKKDTYDKWELMTRELRTMVDKYGGSY